MLALLVLLTTLGVLKTFETVKNRNGLLTNPLKFSQYSRYSLAVHLLHEIFSSFTFTA
jgi:hypothetical protein